MEKQSTVELKIRRYDLSDNPETLRKLVQLDPTISLSSLKQEVRKWCEIDDDMEDKVLKIRNSEQSLVPLSFLTDTKDKFYFLDISNINYIDKRNANLLHDAYVDAVRNKVQNLEGRIAQTELLLPQLEWRRQSFMEETVNGLMSKVAFLNRRFDELQPQFRSKVPETMA